jgi:hypothetical protein
MDGGGVLSILTLFLIRRIERQYPGFLAGVDTFAGTSAGGINSLLMASNRFPEAALEKCIRLWKGYFPVAETPLWRRLASLNGLVATSSNDAFRLYLEHELGESTLGMLHRNVVIPSFYLHAGSHDRWHPIVFHNLGGTGRHGVYLDQLALDVALRTSAAPVMLPIYQGFVDGGLYANNPAMCALAEVLRHHRESGSGQPRPEVSLLSIGTGVQPRHVEVDDADWGWGQWLLNPQDPMLLIEAALDSVESAVEYQCRHLLGEERFLRLNPSIEVVVNHRHDRGSGLDASRLADLFGEVADEWDIRPTLDWLERNEWLRGPVSVVVPPVVPVRPPPARPATPATPAAPATRPRRSRRPARASEAVATPAAIPVAAPAATATAPASETRRPATRAPRPRRPSARQRAASAPAAASASETTPTGADAAAEQDAPAPPATAE